MAVKDILDKIVERHPDVIGAMVLNDGALQHNLEAPYDIIDVVSILETLSEIFDQTAILEDEGYDFGELMLDFANHSFIVRQIDHGLLAVLAPALQRGQLVKLHVGLGVFAKALNRAIEEEAGSLVQEPVVESATHPSAPNVPSDAMVASDPSAEHSEEAEASPDESLLSAGLGIGKKRRGGFRGTKELLASRLARPVDATTEPTPKAKEPEVNADGVPLNPDGTPKKKRIYRGSVFWE